MIYAKLLRREENANALSDRDRRKAKIHQWPQRHEDLKKSGLKPAKIPDHQQKFSTNTEVLLRTERFSDSHAHVFRTA
jgi:hypothetical protein